MALRGSRTREEIEAEIRSCTRSLHEDFKDAEKSNFWRGKISALMWVIGES